MGEDIKRYDIDSKEQYLIFIRWGSAITEYKAIERHLSQFKAQLEPRPPNWNSKTQGQWPGRKPGPYKWYEIQDNIAYYADFEKPKIIYPDIVERSKFAFDPDGHFSTNTTYIMPIEIGQTYLISLLNSSLIEFFYKTVSASIRGGYVRFFTQYVNLIPSSLMKFVPWELTHACLWRIPGWPLAPKVFPPLIVVGLVLVWIIAGVYVLSLFLSNTHQTFYDLLVGVRVVKSVAGWLLWTSRHCMLLLRITFSLILWYLFLLRYFCEAVLVFSSATTNLYSQ